MKKVLSILLTLALVAATAGLGAGCRKDSNYQGFIDEQGVAHVVFMGRDVESERVNYQRVVDSFNAVQQRIKVTMHWFTDGTSYNTMLDGLGTNLPDSLMLSNAMFLRYVSSGKLYDYKARITADELELLYEDGYSAYCYDPAAKTLGYGDGAGLYGLPKDMGPIAICYNADLLRSKINAYNATAAEKDRIDWAQVTDTKNPMKFSTFLEIGKKLKTVMGNDQYVCSGYDLQSAVYSNNANFYTDESAGTSAIDSQNFIDAIRFMQNMYKEGILPSAGTISSGGESLFTSGNAIFFYAGPWKTKDYWAAVDFEWDLIPVLCGDADGAVSTCYVGGMAFCVSANSPVKEYAVEFLKYVALDLNAQRSLYANGQCIPNLKELADEYNGNTEKLLANPEPAHRSVWVDCIDGAGVKTDAQGGSYTDKVSGRYRAEAYTYDETWYTFLTDFMAGNSGTYGSFWQAKNGVWVDVETALKDFHPTLQQSLGELRGYLQ